jgi:hypothetical protein
MNVKGTTAALVALASLGACGGGASGGSPDPVLVASVQQLDCVGDMAHTVEAGPTLVLQWHLDQPVQEVADCLGEGAIVYRDNPGEARQKLVGRSAAELKAEQAKADAQRRKEVAEEKRYAAAQRAEERAEQAREKAEARAVVRKCGTNPQYEGDWCAGNWKFTEDYFGYLNADAKVSYLGTDSGSHTASITVVLINGDGVDFASLSGYASNVGAGGSRNVHFSSSDKIPSSSRFGFRMEIDSY